MSTPRVTSYKVDFSQSTSPSSVLYFASKSTCVPMRLPWSSGRGCPVLTSSTLRGCASCSIPDPLCNSCLSGPHSHHGLGVHTPLFSCLDQDDRLVIGQPPTPNISKCSVFSTLLPETTNQTITVTVPVPSRCLPDALPELRLSWPLAMAWPWSSFPSTYFVQITGPLLGFSKCMGTSHRVLSARNALVFCSHCSDLI